MCAFCDNVMVVLVLCVLVFIVFCTLCTLFNYCFVYVFCSYLFCLYLCKDCCHRVITQLH